MIKEITIEGAKRLLINNGLELLITALVGVSIYKYLVLWSWLKTAARAAKKAIDKLMALVAGRCYENYMG